MRRRQEADFGLGLDVAGVGHAGTGARAGDLEVDVLRASLRGADDHAARERDGVETFALAGPGAGSAQAVAAILFWSEIVAGAAAEDFEAQR